jgi:S-adenosylmethionine hydrolase
MADHGREGCIALLSDFGSQDIYTGVMKAVIAGIAPHVTLVDLTHEIPPGDVRRAAFRLWQALPHVPKGTIFLAVVDPGVGTARRPLAIQTDGFCCVGPDNGIFTYLLSGTQARAVEISNPAPIEKARIPGANRVGRLSVSNTFHGRDIFAPAAGLLASGHGIDRLGREASDIVSISWPRLSEADDGSICGELLFPDRFGNVVTSIGALLRLPEGLRFEPWIPGSSSLTLPSAAARVRLADGIELPLVGAFADVPPGEPLAYIGSDNLLEIGVNRGNAAQVLGLSIGAEIRLFCP